MEKQGMKKHIVASFAAVFACSPAMAWPVVTFASTTAAMAAATSANAAAISAQAAARSAQSTTTNTLRVLNEESALDRERVQRPAEGSCQREGAYTADMVCYQGRWVKF